MQISFDGIGTIRLWIDGVLINSITTSPNVGRSADWQLTIGNFDGDIDEVHIQAIPSPPGAPLIDPQTALATAVAAYKLSHTNPINAPLDGDSDGDGWIDLFELAHGVSDVGNGAPDYHLSMIQLGGETFPAYSIPVISAGEATGNGFISTPFRYTIEASLDLQNWDQPIELAENPASLPPAPAGYRFITFRLRSPSLRHLFFRTTVSEIR